MDLFMVLNKKEYESPLKDKNLEKYSDIKKYATVGPRNPDGSINWQCPCMAGGSLVAHRCGYYFRKLYLCMKEDETKDATEKCPNQFVDWAACMQNMPAERREQMRRLMAEQPKPTD
ncbi:unnamed protein product [Caenorhabditis bovis]|uniref:CHCH domain-containing protein n=1 Tax=Caenorhabditis bovis TaxID=2654633 RepID=A0A8S1F2B6_9PELO|nr:unnamed protein product [Caenorhabditis bovis]